MKTKKFKYFKVIQQNYGQGWEDVSEYKSNSQGHTSEMSGSFITKSGGMKVELSALTHDFREYKLMGYPTRIIFRKEKIKEIVNT